MIYLIFIGAVDVNFRIDEVLYLDIETPFCDLGKIEPFEKSKEYISALKVRVYANVNYELRCEPEGDFISNSGSIIPIERMSVKAKGGEYITLEKSGVTFYKGGITGEMGEVIPIDIMIKPSFEDEPGEYRTRLTITIIRVY